MSLDDVTVAALADAVAERLRPMMLPPGWPPDRPTLREPELATVLAIGVEKLTELRRAGHITFRRIGHSVMYAPGDLAEYLERCRTVEGRP